jgi:hypothetical protein
MKKEMTKTLAAILLVGLFLGAATSAQGAQEVVVGYLHVNFVSTTGKLWVYVSISGTGDIAPGGLSVDNHIPDAAPDDERPTAQDFAKLAESLGCIADVLSVGDEDITYSVPFVCEDRRRKLVSAIGELMSFPLTLSLEKQ